MIRSSVGCTNNCITNNCVKKVTKRWAAQRYDKMPFRSCIVWLAHRDGAQRFHYFWFGRWPNQKLFQRGTVRRQIEKRRLIDKTNSGKSLVIVCLSFAPQPGHFSSSNPLRSNNTNFKLAYIAPKKKERKVQTLIKST